MNPFFENLTFLTDTEKNNISKSTVEILENCVPSEFTSDSQKSNTGVVIGRIQSGKTMSFLSLISLARDNNYGLIIILAGRTNLLLKQTKDRLNDSLVKTDRNIKLIRGYRKKIRRTNEIKKIIN